MDTEVPPPPSLMAMAISLGKIEERLANMAGLDDRLRSLEATVERIEAREQARPPRTPWYYVAGFVFGILASLGVGITCTVALLELASTR